MSQNNLLQGYIWDSQHCEDVESLRPLQDEVISVYEVYVKEEEAASGTSGRSGIHGTAVSAIAGNTCTSGTVPVSNTDDQLVQRGVFNDDCMSLDAAVSSESMTNNSDNNDDPTSLIKLLGKESRKYKIVEQSTTNGEDSDNGYSNQTISEQQNANSFTGSRVIDKDDPRSRLHFVKYLKKDGKTLKIWECGICTKEFRHQYTLMRHLPTHTDERNFKCDACGKAFRQLSTLSQHKAIHSDARPYICEFCKKTFNRVSTLISHRKTHSELKPHKCHVCGKGFHQKGNLRNHVFTHTNERPYKCELCSKGFNQMSNLVCHKIKAHAHSEKMQYSCGLCGKEFPRRFALRSHEEYKHGIKYRNPSGISREHGKSLASHKSTSASSNANVVSATCDVTSTTSATSTETKCIQNKNVRIVELPNHERNNGPEVSEASQTEYTESIVIDKIETKDLQDAMIEGQTPFALLKPVTGIPVLVKVSTAGPQKHLLTPATADDLQILGEVTLSPSLTSDSGMKSLQIKVPVVATITQNFDENGKQSFSVEAPGLDQNQENLVAPLDSRFPFQNTESSVRLHSANVNSFHYRPKDDIVTESAGNTTTTTTTTTTTMTTRGSTEDRNSNNPESDDCNELLELAAQGGIQFVRATEDGRYEVMTNNEARELMAQNSHDVTILDGDDINALDIVNARGIADKTKGCCVQEDFMIDHPDSQIMVLDSLPNNTQKSIDLEEIDIFEDKDIRIIDPKNFDDRIIDGMTFLSQIKMEDLILVPSKSSEGVTNCEMTIASPVNNDLSGIANLLNNNNNNSNNIGTIDSNQSISVNTLLTKAQHSSGVSIISDTMNYLRHCPNRAITEEFNILNAEKKIAGFNSNADSIHSQNQQQSEHCTGRIKFNDFGETLSDDNTNLLSIGHQRDEQCFARSLDYFRCNEAKNYWDAKKNSANFGEVKILGSKNGNIINKNLNQDSLENAAVKLQDIRILSGSYEQFVNTSGFGQNRQFIGGNNYAVEDCSQNARQEVKILGKRLECGFLENDKDGKIVKIEEDAENCRRIVNDFWEGWIETSHCSNDSSRYRDDDQDKENDITYANIIESQTL